MNRKGLTLIEVLVVVTILSALSLSLYTVFKSSVDAWSKSEVRLEIFQNARVVLGQMSRELPGAFVGGNATFEGTDGGIEEIDDEERELPDILEFATNFANSLYQIRYGIDSTVTPPVFRRGYEENPDYSDPSYTWVEFGSRMIRISNIQFLYVYWDDEEEPPAWRWTEDGDWDWDETGELPSGVEITVTLADPDNNTFPFETVVYLPNSE